LQDAAPPVSSFKYQVSTSSLSSAIANALALNPTEDNPVLIQLGPGVYTIYDLRFTNYDLQFAVDSVAAIADRGKVAAAAAVECVSAAPALSEGAQLPYNMNETSPLRSQDGSSTRNQDGSATRGPADAGRTNVERPTSNVTSDIWHLNVRHIYFCGAGPEVTRIVCNRIIVDAEAITGFRDVYLDAVV